jgi:hypothetical protein
MMEPARLDEVIRTLAKSLADEVARIDPNVTHRIGSHSNDVYPYRFWQAFALSDPDFTVVFSVDWWTTASAIKLSADIATDDGTLLAEFRDLCMDASMPAHERGRLTEEWTRELDSFVKSNAGVIVRSLIQGPKPGS